jgi:hypothetical protein
MQPEHGPAVVGLHPQELAAPVRAGEPAADERGGDLPRRVRPADVGVAVVHADDLAAQDAVDLQAGAFGLGELGHRLPGYGATAGGDRRVADRRARGTAPTTLAA